MEVIIRAVFGITDQRRMAEFKRYLPRLSSVNPVVLFMQQGPRPAQPLGPLPATRERVDEMLYEEITQRRADPDGEARNDILTLLLGARDENGAPLTDRELRDELITLLLAGHETTATSIGWAFERLLRNPSVLRAPDAEVEAGEGSEYLDAVIKETLRVRPVVTEVFRSPAEAIELGGYLFEPGSPALRLDRAGSARPRALRARPAKPSGPSASSMERRSPTPGSPSAAACDAASARPSRSSR